MYKPLNRQRKTVFGTGRPSAFGSLLENAAMVFREPAHIQLNTGLYIVAARVSCPISDRHPSV